MIDLEFRIPFHCHEQLVVLLACMNGVPFKYFFFLSLVSIVLWSPRPPRFLGLHMGDQDLRHVGFFSHVGT